MVPVLHMLPPKSTQFFVFPELDGSENVKVPLGSIANRPKQPGDTALFSLCDSLRHSRLLGFVTESEGEALCCLRLLICFCFLKQNKRSNLFSG